MEKAEPWKIAGTSDPGVQLYSAVWAGRAKQSRPDSVSG